VQAAGPAAEAKQMPTDIHIRGRNAPSLYIQTALLPGTYMDWVLTDKGLSEEEELATAVRLALGTDARAGPDEVLPDIDSTDRKGWWGDLDADAIWDGWAPLGCKNWLLLRSKIADAAALEGSTVSRAEFYTRDALQPFIIKRICSAIDVRATRTKRDQIEVWVVLYRGPLPAIELRFAYLWNQVVIS
jgi:phage gp46-like protein